MRVCYESYFLVLFLLGRGVTLGYGVVVGFVVYVYIYVYIPPLHKVINMGRRDIGLVIA